MGDCLSSIYNAIHVSTIKKSRPYVCFQRKWGRVTSDNVEGVVSKLKNTGCLLYYVYHHLTTFSIHELLLFRWTPHWSYLVVKTYSKKP